MKNKAFLGRVGARIRTARMAQGLSSAEFSRQIKCSKSLVSQVEHGVNSMSLTTIRKVKVTLGLKWEELLDDNLSKRCPRCHGTGFIGGRAR